MSQPDVHLQQRSTLPSVFLRDHAFLQQGDVYHHHRHYYPATATNASTDVPPAPSFHVPYPRDQQYIDRGSILADLDANLRRGGSRAALCGLGGIGKSQFAIEYCYRLHETYPDTWVFWIHASNPNRLAQGVREIADYVCLPGRHDPQTDLYQSLRTWLCNERNGKWLIVLDSLDAEATLTLVSPPSSEGTRSSKLSSLRDCFPPSPNGAVLLTTRSAGVAKKLVEHHNILTITPMHRADAIKLMEYKLGPATGHSDLLRLAESLEFMPLAIVQAAALIRERWPRYTVDQYLDDFNQNNASQLSLLNSDLGDFRRDNDAKNSIVITWQLSFDDLRANFPSAAHLLALMSFFDHQSIPEYVLKADVQPDPSRVEGEGMVRISHETSQSFDEALFRLRDYAFVSIEPRAHTLSMHRLVQLATRSWLDLHSQASIPQGQFLFKLQICFPDSDINNWAKCEILFPHAKAAMSLASKVQGNNIAQLHLARILERAGDHSRARGSSAEGLELVQLSVDLLKACQDGSVFYEIALLDGRHALTQHLLDLLELVEADSNCLEVYQRRKELLGNESSCTLTSMLALASIRLLRGQLRDAENLTIEARSIIGTIPEPDNQVLYQTNCLLSDLYMYQFRYKDAETLTKTMLETYTRKCGSQIIETLRLEARLADALLCQQQSQEAEVLCTLSMRSSAYFLGPDHTYTLVFMSLLARALAQQTKWTEAETLQRRALATATKGRGLEHRQTILIMDELADTLRWQGHLHESAELLEPLLDLSPRVFGEEHPCTLKFMYNRALLFAEQGQLEKAIALMQQCQDLRLKVLGPQHANTKHSVRWLHRFRDRLATGQVKANNSPDANCSKADQSTLPSRPRSS